MRRRRPQRGYIMIVVLLLLVVLTTTTATIFDQSSDQTDMSIALRNQSVAQSRALVGARRVLAEFRDPALYPQWNNVELLQPCMKSGVPCTTQNVLDNNCDATTPAAPNGPCRVAISGTGVANIGGTTTPSGVYDMGGNPASGTYIDLDLPDGGGGGTYYGAMVYNAGTAARSRFVVLSVGYRGYNRAADAGIFGPHRFESVVQLEITLPAAASEESPSSGYYF